MPDTTVDVDTYRAALQLLAGDSCHRYTGGTRCSDPDSWNVLGLHWAADAWCTACVAYAALSGTWPTVTDDSPWGVITQSGRILPGEPSTLRGEEMARYLAAQTGGAVIREARPGVWVAAR